MYSGQSISSKEDLIRWLEAKEGKKDFSVTKEQILEVLQDVFDDPNARANHKKLKMLINDLDKNEKIALVKNVSWNYFLYKGFEVIKEFFKDFAAKDMESLFNGDIDLELATCNRQILKYLIGKMPKSTQLSDYVLAVANADPQNNRISDITSFSDNQKKNYCLSVNSSGVSLLRELLENEYYDSAYKLLDLVNSPDDMFYIYRSTFILQCLLTNEEQLSRFWPLLSKDHRFKCLQDRPWELHEYCESKKPKLKSNLFEILLHEMSKDDELEILTSRGKYNKCLIDKISYVPQCENDNLDYRGGTPGQQDAACKNNGGVQPIQEGHLLKENINLNKPSKISWFYMFLGLLLFLLGFVKFYLPIIIPGLINFFTNPATYAFLLFTAIGASIILKLLITNCLESKMSSNSYVQGSQDLKPDENPGKPNSFFSCISCWGRGKEPSN